MNVRNVLAKKTLSQEFTRVPECLIKYGRPYHSNKSDILEVIAPKSKLWSEVWSSTFP